MRHLIFIPSLFVVLNCFLLNPASANNAASPLPGIIESAAIFGDSGSTGVAAAPTVYLSAMLSSTLIEKNYELKFFDHFYKDFDISVPLLVYPKRFFTEPKNFNERIALFAESRLDFEEMSWGFLAASKLSARSENISFFSRNGKRVDHLHHQIELFEKQSSGQMPELIIISFTANDFCHSDIFEPKNRANTLKGYQKNLETQLAKFLNFSPHPKGTKIVLLAPLPVPQILSSPKLGQKITLIHNQIFTCDQIRSPTEKWVAGKNIIAQLHKMCPSIMKTQRTDSEKISFLEELFNQAIIRQQKVISKLSKKSPNGLSFEYYKDSHNLALESTDIANDCFHPSFYGHVKLAKKLFETLNPQNN